MATSLDVLLAEATQLRNIAQALTQRLAEAADRENRSASNHLNYARSHALAIDALCVNVQVGVQCAIDSAAYRKPVDPAPAPDEPRIINLGAALKAAVAADPRA